MVKKALLLLFAAALVFTGGCWNYRGLNEMTIIVGIAIDKSDSGEGYNLTFEAVDISIPIKQQGFKHVLIESEGKTIFDAARNAKKRSENKLYYGHMQLVLINKDIARTEDMSGIIDFFLRDAECRETLCFAVSQEATARELFATVGPGEAFIAMELERIEETDNEVTSSTLCYELYNIYNVLKSEGIALVLPAFHITYNNGIPDVEVNGVAVYKGGRMTGSLSSEESKYFLFVMDKVKGGVLTFSAKSGSNDTSLEISKNRTERSFSVKDGKPVITVKTDTDVYLNEYKWTTGDIDVKELALIKAAAQQSLARSIGDVIKKVQSEYGSDIFGFGDMIRKQDPALWSRLKDNWEETFSSLEVNVDCSINIVNSASIKE